MPAVRSIDEVSIIEVPSVVEAASLQAEVEQLLESGKRKLALDLTQLNFVESSGLGTLVSLYKTVQAQGGQFAMFGIQPYVQKLVEITKLGRVLSIYEDESSAVEALKN